MNYNNVLGFLLIIFFLFQFFSGLLLTNYYEDYYNIAFDSVVYIMIDINIGWYIRLIHFLGSSFFIFFMFIHLIRGIWIKIRIFETNIIFIWLSGLIIFFLSLIEAVFGYSLLIVAFHIELV